MINLSPTQITTWATCHHSWGLQYLERRARPPMGMVAKWGILLHNLVEHAAVCIMRGEDWIAPRPEEYMESLIASAEAAGESADPLQIRKSFDRVIVHVENFRGQYLPRLQPAAVEEGWEWFLTDPETGLEVKVYYRGDLRDHRRFWIDHKLKRTIPKDRGSVPSADLLEQMILVSACPETDDACLQLYAKDGPKQCVIPLGLTTGPAPRFPNRDALVDATARIVLGVARGIASEDSAPTGVWTERWGRQTCYYCSWKTAGACRYQGGS